MRDTRSWTFGDIFVRIIILSLASLILMALQLTGRLAPVQSAITQITSPAQRMSTGVADNIAGWVQFFMEFGELQTRNVELEEINAKLLAENFSLSEVERENARLRELLEFANARPGLELRGAQIVARKLGEDSSNFQDFILIDLGSEHGIRIGMPVTTNAGLVGRITEVTRNTSKVLLITDPNSGVNANLSSSRFNGVIRGNPGGTLIMEYIPQEAEFGIGEDILTSGITISSANNELIGSRFPRGIPIGQVIEIRQRDEEVAQQAIVQPAVEFDELDLVLVITNFDPQEEVPDTLLLDERDADESDITPIPEDEGN
ncbi:rod shape-determining protein MreC [Chloroflexi bacterium TSY]|nr:rod shape-determining protein MreC [Chloroflexi bacterium TSY]